MMLLTSALIHIGIVTAGAYGIGKLIAGRYWHFEQRTVQGVAETALGLLLLSQLIFFLSAFHLVSRNIFFVLLAALGLAAVAGIFSFKRSPPDKDPCSSISKKWGLWVALLPVLLYFGWIAACACLPPSDRDELIYHLEIPRQFLAHGGLVRFQDNIYGYFPQLGEMLFLFGLGASGELAAKFYHILYGALLAAGLYGYSRIYLDKKNSALAVLLFLSIPLVIVTLPLAYVDLIFSLYAFLALLCLLQFFKTTQLRWTVLAGIFTGACMATKYTGIQVLFLLTCLLLLEHLIRRRKTWPLGACILALAAFPFFLPYVWRNWSLTGWPLFPFATGHLELSPFINWDAERARLFLAWLGTFGAPLGGQTIGHILFAPILVFVTAKFNDPQFYEGVLGPVFLLTPFFLVFQRDRKPKEIRGLIVFSLLFLFHWALTTRQSRFLLPILPVLSFLLVYGLASLRKFFLTALVIVLMLYNLFTGIKETCAKDPFSFWFSKETREDYLARQWPGAAIYREANKRLGPADRLYLINMKNYGYYLDVPVRADFVFERYNLDRVLAAAPSVAGVVDFFKRNGISHLLMDEGFVLSPEWGLEPGQREIFQDFLTRHAESLVRDRNFVLYRLRGMQPLSDHEGP